MVLALDNLLEGSDASRESSNSALLSSRWCAFRRALRGRPGDKWFPSTEMGDAAGHTQTTRDLAVAFL